jgi:hypothetical protein
MGSTNRTLYRLGYAAALVAATAATGPLAEARITQIVIMSTESPTFKDTLGVARSFGAVGPYEKLRGIAKGEIDPLDPQNALITDIELAPRNARGMVEYDMDIYLLKPTDLTKGNHKLYMEVNNRGSKLFGNFNGSTGGNNPTTAAHAGDAFLMNLGYSLAWSGWDYGAAGADSMDIRVPLAKNPDGSTITGPSYEYITFTNTNATLRMASPAFTYAAADLDKSKATLTVKAHLRDPAVTIPSSGWDYTSSAGTAIKLLPNGTAFNLGDIYEFSYTAKDPLVAGVGFAATRDFLSFLKNRAADDFGNPNPLAGHVKQIYTFTVSQPARFLNDFENLGFNEDEDGRRVIDGILNWIGAGNGINMNFRFAQQGRTERNRQNHLYAEANFPFTYEHLKDHLTGKRAGRADRCSGVSLDRKSGRHRSDDRDDDRNDRHDDDDDRDNRRNTCAKSLQASSANEYWVKAGSLLHTDTRGRDLEQDPKHVRFYMFSSKDHSGNFSPLGSAFGICQQHPNIIDPNPALRALFIALDKWVTKGVKPPESAVPSEDTKVYSIPLSDGVGFVPQRKLGWPNIPGVTYTGVITVRNLFDWGPRFDDGILDINPPDFIGRVYPSFVSKVDRDGNDIAGIRLPPVVAPIGTSTGWALRKIEFGGPDGCEASGQFIPFKKTKAERLAAGDPRLSLEERYKDHASYVAAVTKAARHLEKRRLLLPADVQRYIDAAQASTVPQ